jgi:O-antigen ligase
MHASDDSGVAHPKVGSSILDRSAKVLGKVIFSCLLALIVLTVIPYGTVDAWWEAVFECSVFALTAIWIFAVLLRGSWQVSRLFILLPLILITTFAFAQAVEWSWLPIGVGRLTAQHRLSIDRYQTYLTARKTLALTLFLGLLLLHTSTPRQFRWLVRVVIGIGLASALFGILRQLLQSPDATTGFLLPFLFPGVGYGEFISQNVFAYLMEMTFALLAGLVLGGGVSRRFVLVYSAGGAVIWAALILANSRGGVLSLTVLSIFLLFVSLNWYSARRLSREGEGGHKWLAFIQASLLVRILVIALIVGTLVAGILWMGGERLGLKISERASTSNQANFDGTGRKEIWHSTWELIKKNPWTGVGFGAFFLAIPEYQIGSGRIKVEQAHNDYLDLAVNGGVVAVGLAGWFLVMMIWRARSSLRSRDAYRRAACLGSAAGILGVAVHSLVDFGLQVTGIAVIALALVVISVAGRTVESTSGERKIARPSATHDE